MAKRKPSKTRSIKTASKTAKKKAPSRSDTRVKRSQTTDPRKPHLLSKGSASKSSSQTKMADGPAAYTSTADKAYLANRKKQEASIRKMQDQIATLTEPSKHAIPAAADFKLDPASVDPNVSPQTKAEQDRIEFLADARAEKVSNMGSADVAHFDSTHANDLHLIKREQRKRSDAAIAKAGTLRSQQLKARIKIQTEGDEAAYRTRLKQASKEVQNAIPTDEVIADQRQELSERKDEEAKPKTEPRTRGRAPLAHGFASTFIKSAAAGGTDTWWTDLKKSNPNQFEELLASAKDDIDHRDLSPKQEEKALRDLDISTGEPVPEKPKSTKEEAAEKLASTLATTKPFKRLPPGHVALNSGEVVNLNSGHPLMSGISAFAKDFVSVRSDVKKQQALAGKSVSKHAIATVRRKTGQPKQHGTERGKRGGMFYRGPGGKKVYVES